MSNTGPDSARDPHGISKTVEVCEFRLDIGAPTGMAISLPPEAVAQKDNQADLTAALAQEDRDDQDRHGAVAKIDDASRKSDDITTQVERADSLWIGLATDRLSVSAVNNEIDTLLAVLQRLDQAGHFDDQLRLARALSRVLAVALRWIDLLRSLRALLAAAKHRRDGHAKAWALHELGTLRLAAGDLVRADDALTEASELRQALGDARGLAATERNLSVLCRTLRRWVREGRLVDRKDRARRPRAWWPIRGVVRRTALLVIGIICLVLILGGVVLAATHHKHPRATLVARTDGQGHIVSRPAGIDCPTTCTAHFRPSTPVSLSATAAANASFVGWRGACSGRGLCLVRAGPTETVIAMFARRRPASNVAATLTVRTSGRGSVQSHPAGIDCPGSCTARFRIGQTVTLSPNADAGATFTSWTGDCAGTGACTLTMDANHSVTADFATPTLTVTVTGAGSVQSRPSGIDCPARSCSATFSPGETVTLTPSPDRGSHLITWTGDCSGKRQMPHRHGHRPGRRRRLLRPIQADAQHHDGRVGLGDGEERRWAHRLRFELLGELRIRIAGEAVRDRVPRLDVRRVVRRRLLRGPEHLHPDDPIRRDRQGRVQPNTLRSADGRDHRPRNRHRLRRRPGGANHVRLRGCPGRPRHLLVHGLKRCGGARRLAQHVCPWQLHLHGHSDEQRRANWHREHHLHRGSANAGASDRADRHPARAGFYAVGQSVRTRFSCADASGAPGIESCADSNGGSAPAGSLNTSALGTHTYTVTATSKDGKTATASVAYTVAGPPSVTIKTPAEGAKYLVGETEDAAYGCSEGTDGPGLQSEPAGCSGSVPDGTAISTAAIGSFSFSVTATSTDGQTTPVTVQYSVCSKAPGGLDCTAG